MTDRTETIEEAKAKMQGVYDEAVAELEEKLAERVKIDQDYQIAKAGLSDDIKDLKTDLSNLRKQLGIKAERLPIAQTIKTLMDGEDMELDTLVDSVCSELKTTKAKVKMAINGMVKREKLTIEKDDDGGDWCSI